MSRGKYLSLEEARKRGLIDRFCKEHPSEADEDRFRRLLESMTNPKPAEQSPSEDEQT